MNRDIVGWIVCGVVVIAGCDGASSASLDSRCTSWCERRNMDADCGAEINCPASCSSIILSAGERCEGEVGSFLTCAEASDDLCPDPSTIACRAESDAIAACSTASVDAGTPACMPFGTYTGVSGGTSATACGRMLTTFTDATVTIAEAPGGGALLTVTGTTSSSDVTDCEATISETCELTATCVFEDGGSASYTLQLYTSSFTGTTSVSIPGDCTLPWSIEGSR